MTKKTTRSKKHFSLDIARDIAEYYGFLPLAEAMKGEGRMEGRTKIPETPFTRPALIEWLLTHAPNSFNSPLLLYRMEAPSKEKSGFPCFAMEIFGVPRSVAEAVLFQISSAILREAGYEDFLFEVNSLGDRESIAKFQREFNIYYKNRAEEVPGHCRNNLKKDVFKVLACSNDRCMLIKEGAPKPISCLSEGSRTNFTEVLNFLEGMKHSYRINDCLVGGKDFYTKTVFEIITEREVSVSSKKGETKQLERGSLAKGGRYDDLSKKLGHKREIPAVGITLLFEGREATPYKNSNLKTSSRKHPVASLVQVGFEAKLKSLEALEILRHAKIPLEHSLLRERLSAQMGGAEKLGAAFLIIIGQKEAMEHAAIIRDKESRSQETIPIERLPQYLKKGHL
ncbi:MAG: His/Gly/Thr/Pro-type tRNA ligase C-terminal domain-containing protein [Patescibacteria group bacterium]